MHIKTGTWESSNAVCESDPMCDPAVLVSPSKPEPQIRNRRLSPGSGSCGGGGGGCSSGMNKRQGSPSSLDGSPNGAGHTQNFTSSRDKERRVPNKGRSFRRDGPRSGPRSEERHSRRWVEDSLSLLKPPPAFPVKDSPAKLQPAVSYASKVKAGGWPVGAAEEPPGIGVLLQNQWGLSFISDGAETDVTQETNAEVTGKAGQSIAASPARDVPKGSESSEELLLSCRHLEEALEYHSHEWNAILWRQKQDPADVVWYLDDLESPA